MNPKIFKPYDIRGIYPLEFNQKDSYLIGQSLIKFLSKKFKKSATKIKIVVGRDCRISSEEIFHHFSKGIRSQGGNVINIGIVPTELVYFAHNYYKTDAGIMITASHNPPEYNGFKIIIKNNNFISQGQGMGALKNFCLRKNLYKTNKKQGKEVKRKINSIYLKFILKKIKTSNLLPLKVVLDFGNGCAGKTILSLLKYTPAKTTALFPDCNGLFPSHLPDPSNKKNLRLLSLKIKEQKANLGVAFDGDGDRIVFLDEKGRIIDSDFIILLISKYLLLKNPGKKIVYTKANCSRLVPKKIKEFQGIPVKSKTGHTFVKKIMQKHQGIFGGESSGHFYWKEFYYLESSALTLLNVLKIISQENVPFSQIISQFPKSYKFQTNLKIKKPKETIFNKLENIFPLKNFRKESFDGLSLIFNNWWFNIRASNTEKDKFRLTLEADNLLLLKEKRRTLLKLLNTL